MKSFLAVLLAMVIVAPVRGADKPRNLGITLTSPLDYQVFQRRTREAGRIVVEGSVNTPPKSLEPIPGLLQARVLGESLPGEWQSLPLDPRVPKFRGELTLPAGGWYKVEVRLQLDEQTLGSTVVEHVGIGEVFVIAGQSNSGNYGSEKLTTQTGLVSSFGGNTWQLANDPQPGAGGNGGSFQPSFGDEMVRRLKVPIGIAGTGAGGTSVREWLPQGVPIANPPTVTTFVIAVEPNRLESTGTFYSSITTRMKKLGPHGFRAVLWHQGESDANQAVADRTLSGENYRRYLETLVRATQREMGWDVPWFVAQASYHSERDPGSPDIRDAQKSLWTAGIAHEGPDTDALRANLRAGVHFNGEGLRRHGQLWAEKVTPWLEQQLGPPAKP